MFAAHSSDSQNINKSGRTGTDREVALGPGSLDAMFCTERFPPGATSSKKLRHSLTSFGPAAEVEDGAPV
jgi:hypothetical protein